MGTPDLDSSKTEILPASTYELKDSNSPASGSIDCTPMNDLDHSDTTATVADPRPAINGPFTFTSDQLMDLVDPKSPATLIAYGGVQGVLAGLHANPTRGLSTSERSLAAVVTSDVDEKVDTPAEFAPSTSGGPVTMAEREEFFGRNVLPKRKPKTIFQLMWMALQEKILVRREYSDCSFYLFCLMAFEWALPFRDHKGQSTHTRTFTHHGEVNKRWKTRSVLLHHSHAPVPSLPFTILFCPTVPQW